MMWRVVVLASLATGAVAWWAPASAQWFPQWEQQGQRPFWEQKPRRQPNTRNQPGWGQQWDDGWGDYDEPRRGARVVGGGPRPEIIPLEPETVAFTSEFAPNSIVIDTAARKLYFVLSPTEAYQYPISVGRQGYSWTGSEVISRVAEWPDWHPPKEMIARDRRLPDKMMGGLRNPLGAKALYLGNSLYRIHGTNDAKTIGQAASSGCFRMLNGHVVHLASLVDVGTPVTVVKRLPPAQTISAKPEGLQDPARSTRMSLGSSRR